MNRRDENKGYFIINSILTIIAVLIIIYIIYLVKENKSKFVKGYETSTNALISILKVDNENTELQNKTEENIVIQLVEDNNKTEYTYNKIKNNKFFYNQLTENAKNIYDAIQENLDNMKSGTYSIKLPKSISKILETENGEQQLNIDFQSAWDALNLDRMDIFFLDITKINLVIEKTTYLTRVSYNLTMQPVENNTYLENGFENREIIDNVLSQINESKNMIISNLSGNQYDKVLQIHDWLIENLEYSKDVNHENAYNIYGAMIEKSAVCEGYAELFKYLLDEIDIPCILVSGNATNSNGETESHAWNYVKIDEKWYAVDSTWDDPVLEGFGYISNSTKHKYFLKGAGTMSKNHVPNGKVSKNGKTFEYPQLQLEDYK